MDIALVLTKATVLDALENFSGLSFKYGVLKPIQKFRRSSHFECRHSRCGSSIKFGWINSSPLIPIGLALAMQVNEPVDKRYQPCAANDISECNR